VPSTRESSNGGCSSRRRPDTGQWATSEPIDSWKEKDSVMRGSSPSDMETHAPTAPGIGTDARPRPALSCPATRAGALEAFFHHLQEDPGNVKLQGLLGGERLRVIRDEVISPSVILPVRVLGNPVHRELRFVAILSPNHHPRHAAQSLSIAGVLTPDAGMLATGCCLSHPLVSLSEKHIVRKNARNTTQA